MNDFNFELPEVYNTSAVLFDNLEAGQGDKVAIYCGEEAFTYAHLADTANRVGNSLKNLGVEAGSRVLMLVLDGPQFSSAFFGAIRAGSCSCSC